MDSSLVMTLAGLALLDATGIGTLVVPLWLLLDPGAPRPASLRMPAHLVIVVCCYAFAGTAVLTATRWALDGRGGVPQTTLVSAVQLGGVALVVLAVVAAVRRRSRRAPDRLTAWRRRALAGQQSWWAMLRVAVAAGAADAATIVPYAAAIALLVLARASAPATAAVLAGYCVAVVAPALLLGVARTVAGDRMRGPLEWVDGRLSRWAGVWVAAVLGGVGVLLTAGAGLAAG